MPPPLAPAERPEPPVTQNSASHESSNRRLPADLDAAADATGQLDILDAEDILESDEISALEAAADGIVCFEVATPEPSGFEVGDVGAFEEVEVEGEIEAPPPSLSTLFGIKPKAAPIKAAVIPAAPVTSPLPLESVVAAEAPTPAAAAAPAPASERETAPVSKSEPIADRTLELKRSDFAIAVATAKIEAEERATHDARATAEDAPGQTQVLVRAAMPAAIRTMQGGIQAPTRRPSSIAPVALDIAAAPRATAPSVPAFPAPARMPSYASVTPKRGLSGVAIGVIAFSALALVGLVGIGGFAASRALTEKSEPVAAANESAEVPPSAVVAPAAAPAPEAPNASPSTIGTGFAIDVSALPTAPVPGAAPRIATGRTTAPSAPAGAPLAAAGPVAPAPVNKSSGGALPPPGGGKVASAPLAAPGAPLPPPAAAAPAPAAPVVVATTGTVRVDPNLRAVVVDGSFRRANDGVVVVACGSHRIKVGMKSEQSVNVPCGGSVAL